MSASRPQGSTERIEVHDLATLPRACREDWLALFAARPDAGFEHHPAWFDAIDAHLLPGTLRVGLSRDADGPRALLVLAGGADERTARHPRHEHLPLGDVLLHPRLGERSVRAKGTLTPPDRAASGTVDGVTGGTRGVTSDDGAAVREAVGDILRAMAPRAEVWRIADVPESSPLVQALNPDREDAGDDGEERRGADRSAGEDGREPTRVPPGWARRPSRPSLAFDLTGEGSVVPGKLRRNLARLRRRLAAEGTLSVERVRERDALGAAWARFLDVEASGWKGAEGTGTAIRDDPALRGFYGALLDAADAGPGLAPVVDLLWLDERCIAAQLGLEANGRLSLLKIGYDERHAASAPGSLLLEDGLALAREEGLHTLGLVTAPAWAERWHPERRRLWHAVRYGDSFGGRRRHALDRLEDAVRRRVRR